MSEQEILEKKIQTPEIAVVSPSDNVQSNGTVAKEIANKLVGKKQKSKPKSKPKQKNEPKSIASVAQQRFANFEKREKRLVEIVEKRTATIAKMQGNLEIFKTALVKVYAQKAAELKAIKELTEVFSNNT